MDNKGVTWGEGFREDIVDHCHRILVRYVGETRSYEHHMSRFDVALLCTVVNFPQKMPRLYNGR